MVGTLISAASQHTLRCWQQPCGTWWHVSRLQSTLRALYHLQKTRDNYGVRPDADAESVKASNRSQKHLPSIGHGLGGPIEDHLKQENQKQDEAIGTIEDVLGDLKVAAMVRCYALESLHTGLRPFEFFRVLLLLYYVRLLSVSVQHFNSVQYSAVLDHLSQ